MDNKEFSKQLEIRTKNLAIQIIPLCASMHETSENKLIKVQLVKSGTSVGANYREAKETLYWLEIIGELNWVDSAKLKTCH